ncbi:MAG TPA: winged helix-turn-helix domain-containing protein [Candidatus Binatia bacterium]|nr:winged helix-turn-helix domain-containing protein [Candidatus Binatia bacterium]
MTYVFSEFALDDQLYQLYQAGQPVKIEPQVFKLLAYLIAQRDRVVSREELFEKLWPGQVVSEAALTYCVAKARKAVQDHGTRQRLIKTPHGHGYRFIAQVTVPVDDPSPAKVVIPEDQGLPIRLASRTDRQGRRLALLGLLFIFGWVTSLWQVSFRSSAIPGVLPVTRQEAIPEVTQTEGKLCQGWVLSTHNQAALDSLLRGWDYYNLLTQEAHVQARRRFQHAVELDPSYAAAYASLGWLYWREWLSSGQDPHDLERASLHMQKAIALDASCPHTHVLLANVYLMQKRHTQAVAEAEQAIALDPTCTRCYTELATILTFAGRPQEAALVENALFLILRRQ